MISTSLLFVRPGQVTTQDERLHAPGANQVQVKTIASAISAGTEMLIYRGQLPEDISLDDNIPALSGAPRYPIKYGYSLAGEITAVGARIDPAWLGRNVFVFHPHTSRFNTPLESTIALPKGISPEEAVFLPNIETAVNFLMDGKPMIGERVVVFGQGIVGLLTTSLLARSPLSELITVEDSPLRREVSLSVGARHSISPREPDLIAALHELLGGNQRYTGADLVYELTGNPEVLNHAIETCAFSGRIVVGSWYGQKQVPINLGGRFHRARQLLISSQVSTLAPEFSGRWDKARRLDVAWKMLAELNPSRLITHRFPIANAQQAYSLLSDHPEQTLQVVFTYP